jgi:branched-chain amino acid transport system permease protein
MAVGYGESTYRDAIAFIILVLILLLKPTGIMGKGMTEKV